MKRPEPKFRNRVRELEEVVSALRNDDDSHFWLFVAPPQLGKTWFLREIGEGLKRVRVRSLVHEVDARELLPYSRDPLAMLARMYGLSLADPDSVTIAAAISATARYNLCLLDSAELLGADAIRVLRKGLEEADRYLREGRSREARLALVVASRQDDAWSGVAPLRMSIRKLTEFQEDVFLDALVDLAREMDTDHSRADLRPLARRVHRLSEGLPALLTAYLAWIRQAQWVGLHRLDHQDCFDQIATPYIEHDLLCADSLDGRRPDPPQGMCGTLIEALVVLARYRYFTGSHLSHHAKQDVLRHALERLGWNEEKLWTAVRRTDLLLLPQDEPWYAISPPIRRLLFRHWYGPASSRAQAHRAAREFLEDYAQNLTGRERAELLIECLWHEAERLTLVQDAAKAGLLTALTRRLSRELTGAGPVTSGFHDRAVREFTDRRMGNDQELLRAVGDEGLFEDIRAIMMHPEGGSMP